MGRAISSWVFGFAFVTGAALVLTSACGGDDGGGGGSGGKDAGNDGSGGTGATGGSGGTGAFGGTGAKGGTGGGGGCLPAPDPTDPTACDTCQDEDHGSCQCDSAAQACLADNACAAIMTCTFDETTGCLEFTAEGAACVHACIAKNPAGQALYLAFENCLYCDFCGKACDTGTYCTALNDVPDGGTDSGTDADTDAPTEAASDAPTEAASDAPAEAASDAPAEAASDATTD